MGYSYSMSGRLCCDVCGKEGGVRKKQCPFNWCQALAICPSCRTKYPAKEWRARHLESRCDISSAKYREEILKEKEMLENGLFLRCSALNHDNGKTKVIFRGKDGEKAYWMEPETYRALPYGKPLTPDDYAKIGSITEAKTTDIYDQEGQ